MSNAIDKLHEFERFGSVLGLERMTVLLKKLGDPHEKLKVIHVAGTNGKGSICKYLYEVLQASGYKTGLYTSPFLQVFNERIQFDGEYISDADLNKYTDLVLAKVDEMVEEGFESPTEFEVVTAIAFLYFMGKNANIVILEVGLGGRGDSTNVVSKPLVSIIASISLDHTDRLGNTIAEIAFEKAGIIKNNCPVIMGTYDDEAKEVIKRRCLELSAPCYDASELRRQIISESIDGCRFTTEIFGEEEHIDISMIGRHQIDNAITALYALRLLNNNGNLPITSDSVKIGFKAAKQIGRFEILSYNPYIIIDGAHNPDGSKALKNTVKANFPGKKILMITGILADKDSDEILKNFTQIAEDFVVTEPENPRKMRAEELAEKISTKAGKCIIIKEVDKVVEYVLKQRAHYDVILFAGSLYLIGQVRGLLKDGK